MSKAPDFSAIENLPPLRDVIRDHDLRAQKSLGQNFLLDGNITDKIVSFIASDITPETTIFEIGPGPGGLTRSLLKTETKSVKAIEFDGRAVEALQSLNDVSAGRLELLQQDALDSDICAISAAPRLIAANLPYNIATPLLIKWLKIIRKNPSDIDAMALMFQKEVGDRICAQKGTKAYGRLSVMTQWLCHVRIVYVLPPSAFTPPPKVDSAVLKFVPKTLDADSPSFEKVEMVTAKAFNQRRKMIRASLKEHVGVIEELGLDPTLRAENLSVQDFVELAKRV